MFFVIPELIEYLDNNRNAAAMSGKIAENFSPFIRLRQLKIVAAITKPHFNDESSLFPSKKRYYKCING